MKKCIFPNGCECEHHDYGGPHGTKPCTAECNCSCVEKVEPQYLKKGTRVKILVDRDRSWFKDKITCHTGIIADGEDDDGEYGVRADNGRYFVVKTSDVEEIREEKLEYRGIPIQVSSLVPPDTMYCWNEDSQVQFNIKNSPKKGGKNFMSYLKTIPARLKRELDKNTRLQYEVGFIDGELEITREGESTLTDYLYDLHKNDKEFIALMEKRKKDLKKMDEEEGVCK